MLDYDAMRSKVKKLVEKPDKDPAKLPRTEKETEMVSMQQFLDDPEHLEDVNLDNINEDVDLAMPSPPKVLDHIKRVQQIQNEEESIVRRHSGVEGLGRSPSIIRRVSNRMSVLRSPKLGTPPSEQATGLLQRSPTISSLRPPSMRFPRVRDSSSEGLLHRSASSPPTNFPMSQRLSASPSISISDSMRKRQLTQSSRPSLEASLTPFFHPSDLEQLMQPLREEYIRMQTNLCAQAKVAYDQLNEQLTSELPQLIDLR